MQKRNRHPRLFKIVRNLVYLLYPKTEVIGLENLPDEPCAVIGKPIRFSSAAPFEEERRRIYDTLMNDITALACALPEHMVVPYRNISKHLYPKNTQKEREK